jgi:hypothetical protein
MGKRHTPEFSREMIKFYKTKKNATIDQARNRAARLGYDDFSKAAHDRYRKEAVGKTQLGKAQRAPAGKRKVPDRCWMDLKTGKFYTDFAEGHPGTKVVIFDRVADGTISLAYPQEKKGSRKRK